MFLMLDGHLRHGVLVIWFRSKLRFRNCTSYLGAFRTFVQFESRWRSKFKKSFACHWHYNMEWNYGVPTIAYGSPWLTKADWWKECYSIDHNRYPTYISTVSTSCSNKEPEPCLSSPGVLAERSKFGSQGNREVLVAMLWLQPLQQRHLMHYACQG